ncbi:class I SAM-dependent methyltransferase [Dokdonia ponticola]|uniref:Class I SAM-dependent methyltransferase n=1 Tax=Dokdonia ponticola TaxID=2041041 RepID=A0ABV9HZX7_9FLAO
MNTKQHKSKQIKKPWPTKAAMEQVYEMNLWGGDKADFYSGEGSYHPDIVNPYLEAVTSFLTSFETPLMVCDLGCGDFNVGKHLVKHTKKYIAVDIVGDLIEYNKAIFKEKNLEFQCLNLAKDALPSGDCALVRQVLQHLSNNEVQQILKKLTYFKYVILTEHLPEGDFIPNKDIISGQGTRLKKKSGLNVLLPPFHFNVKEEKLLNRITLEKGKGIIETTLYKIS